MQLCIVNHSFVKGHGQGRVNYEVVKEAIRQRHVVTLLSSDLAPDLQHHPQVNWVPIKVQQLPTELLRNMAFSIQTKRWLKKHRSQFDLVKVNGAITAARSDINAVHFVHSSWLTSQAHTSRIRQDLYGIYQGIYTAINAYWEKHAFRQTKRVIAVSNKIAHELTNIGVPNDRIQVIVNGVNLEEFYPDHAERAALKLPENVTLALFAGDIQTPRKNLDTILQALARVPNLHLAIAGNISDSPYPKMAQELGIEKRTHFLGYRRDIPKLMQAVDFFVFPSRYEACTLVLLEAMASGLPVITATTAGGAEIVTEDSGIVLNNPNDITDLTNALNQLANDTALRHRMGKSARSVAEQHSWQTMAEQYIELFETAA